MNIFNRRFVLYIGSSLLYVGMPSFVYAQFGIEPIEETTSLGQAGLPDIIANLINVALSFLGIILVILILYSGFVWMTAGGNEERLKKARGTLVGAIIGLIIILASGSIVRFVIETLQSATGGR